MPLTNNGSYLPTMQEFISHWTAVNAALVAPDVLTLAGGYSLANFTTDRAAIQTATTAIEAVDNGVTAAQTDRNLKKAALKLRVEQFRAAIMTQFPGSIYESMLPAAPVISNIETRFLKPFDDVANLWSRVNTDTIAGFTPPLKLPGAYVLATFTTDLAALRTAYLAVTNADLAAQNSRRLRDSLLPPAKARMKQYRSAVPSKLLPGNPLLTNIPAISPPNTGPAADMVSASGAWSATAGMAVLTWTQSTLSNEVFAQYQVRTAPGPTYKAKNEETISDALDTKGITTFSTDAGLTTAGSTALFRVYVVTSGGREKGSATVKVTRP